MWFKKFKKKTSIDANLPTIVPSAYPRTQTEWRIYLLAELARFYAVRVGRVYEEYSIIATMPEWRVAPRYISLGVRLANMRDIDKALSLNKAIGHACGMGDGTQEPPILINLLGGLLVYQFLLPQHYQVGREKIELWESVYINHRKMQPGAVGLSLYDRPVFFDFTDSAAHALIAGASGSGKTELLRTVLYQLLSHTPIEQLRFGLGDPAGRLLDFKNEQHLLWQPVYDVDQVKLLTHFFWLEFKRRFEQQLTSEPRWVLVIDEADQLGLANDDEMQQQLTDIVMRGRGVKVNLIVCSHRPDQGSLGPFATQLTNRWFGKTANARESGLFEGGLKLHHLSGMGDFYTLNLTQPLRFQAALTPADLIRSELVFNQNIKSVTASTGPVYVPDHLIEPDKPAHRPRLETTPEVVAYLRFYGVENINKTQTMKRLGLSRRELDLNIQFARRQAQIEQALHRKYQSHYVK